MESTPIGQTIGLRKGSFARPGADSGYDEQWQRALEKAYFEKQVAAMHSTGSQDIESESGKDVTPGKADRNSAPQEETANGEGYGRVLQPDRNAMNEVSPLCASSGALKNHPAALLSLGGTLALPASGVVLPPGRVSVGTSTISASREVAMAVQGLLPSTNSVKTFVTDQGVHVIMRDPSLDGVEVLRMLKKIRDVLADGGHRLVALTLNGELIWEDRGRDDAPSGIGHIDQRFEQSY